MTVKTCIPLSKGILLEDRPLWKQQVDSVGCGVGKERARLKPGTLNIYEKRYRVHRNCVDAHAVIASFRPVTPPERNMRKGISVWGLS